MITPMFEGGSYNEPDGTLLYQIKYVQSLPLSSDVGNYRIMPGCQLEQIAYFDDSTATLSIANNWNELDWVDRSALIAHEISYYLDRRYAMEYFAQNMGMTSERARAFVGKLLSSTAIKPHADSIPTSGFAKCSDSENNGADSTYGYFFDDGSGNVVGVFTVIHGHDSVYQLKTAFPGVAVGALTDLNNGVASSEAPLEFSGEVNPPAFSLRISKTAGSAVAFDLLETKMGVQVPLAPTQTLNCWFPQP
jgi:hypothetical protein